MKTYFAFVLKEPDSAYGIVVPDVPGCFSAGDTYDEAVRNASQALQAHLETLRDNGKPVPEPRNFEDLMADPEVRADAVDAPWIAVPLHLEGDTVEISLPMTSDLLDAIDAAARRSGLSRAAFLAEAARAKIAG